MKNMIIVFLICLLLVLGTEIFETDKKEKELWKMKDGEAGFMMLNYGWWRGKLKGKQKYFLIQAISEEKMKKLQDTQNWTLIPTELFNKIENYILKEQ